jgi:uncharacterized protein
MASDMEAPRVWAVHDGRIGIANQVLGLAEAVGWPFEEKRIEIRFPWTKLAPQFWLRPLAAPGPGGDRLAPPWPDLVIGCGRQTAAPVAAVRRASGGGSFAVQIQDPTLPLAWYDLLVVPEHDRRRGANVLATRGAVHRVTAARLAEAAARFAPLFADLPRPLVAVLIGGNNKSYQLTERRLAALAEQLAAISRRHGSGLLVTPSRRTGAEGERILREKLAGLPARIWDGGGENPYFGYLALADAILVTEDSVSMVTEATATGKPVHVVSLAGGSRKFREFHRQMREAGITRPFTGALEEWRYAPPNDTALAAAEIRRRIGIDAPATMTAAAGESRKIG